MGNRCVGWASGSNVAQQKRGSGVSVECGGKKRHGKKDNAEARRSLRNAEISAHMIEIVKKEG